jgi:cell division protein FtsX
MAVSYKKLSRRTCIAASFLAASFFFILAAFESFEKKIKNTLTVTVFIEPDTSREGMETVISSFKRPGSILNIKRTLSPEFLKKELSYDPAVSDKISEFAAMLEFPSVIELGTRDIDKEEILSELEYIKSIKCVKSVYFPEAYADSFLRIMGKVRILMFSILGLILLAMIMLLDISAVFRYMTDYSRIYMLRELGINKTYVAGRSSLGFFFSGMVYGAFSAAVLYALSYKLGYSYIFTEELILYSSIMSAVVSFSVSALRLMRS